MYGNRHHNTSIEYCLIVFFFRYLYHLWNLLSTQENSKSTKLISNCFRMVHACICSMPLMVINLSTLMKYGHLPNEYNEKIMNIKEIQSQMARVDFHGLAFLLSLINFVRAVCLFNERKTMTVLFGIVALPMTVVTAICRIIILAVVFTFVEPVYSMILLIW